MKNKISLRKKAKEKSNLVKKWRKESKPLDWFDIFTNPPEHIDVLICIKNAIFAVGTFNEKNKSFICCLPTQDGYCAVNISIVDVTYWMFIPTINKDKK